MKTVKWGSSKYKVEFFNRAGKRIVTNPPVPTIDAAVKMGESQLAFSRRIGDTEYHSYKVIKL
jgi:hypothetical protein